MLEQILSHLDIRRNIGDLSEYTNATLDILSPCQRNNLRGKFYFKKSWKKLHCTWQSVLAWEWTSLWHLRVIWIVDSRCVPRNLLEKGIILLDDTWPIKSNALHHRHWISNWGQCRAIGFYIVNKRSHTVHFLNDFNLIILLFILNLKCS